MSGEGYHAMPDFRFAGHKANLGIPSSLTFLSPSQGILPTDTCDEVMVVGRLGFSRDELSDTFGKLGNFRTTDDGTGYPIMVAVEPCLGYGKSSRYRRKRHETQDGKYRLKARIVGGFRPDKESIKEAQWKIPYIVSRMVQEELNKRKQLH